MKLETLLVLGVAGYALWLIWWNQQCRGQATMSATCQTWTPPFAAQVDTFFGV
jgi:hypothetical protein